jgi:hypothetical protein
MNRPGRRSAAPAPSPRRLQRPPALPPWRAHGAAPAASNRPRPGPRQGDWPAGREALDLLIDLPVHAADQQVVTRGGIFGDGRPHLCQPGGRAFPVVQEVGGKVHQDEVLVASLVVAHHAELVAGRQDAVGLHGDLDGLEEHLAPERHALVQVHLDRPRFRPRGVVLGALAGAEKVLEHGHFRPHFFKCFWR